ncbi:Ig-like domain-containing protein [Falsiporphyromonas endometrii]|uniref:Ig-like domain-containing protein n=1 Tax=Falsiporphyromonas endometrii TaxID=1387297 RepID=A0ABV9K5A9_9PORP
MKRFFKYAIAAVAALTLAGFAVSCGSDDDDKNDVEITAPKGTEISVKVGETVTAEVAVRPAGTTLTWASADETKATVKDGAITGVAEGKTTVTATAKGKSVTFNVTVTKKENGGGDNPQTGKVNELPRLIFDNDEAEIKKYEEKVPRTMTQAALPEVGLQDPVPVFANKDLSTVKGVVYGLNNGKFDLILVGCSSSKIVDLLTANGFEAMPLENGSTAYINESIKVAYMKFPKVAQAFQDLGCDEMGAFMNLGESGGQQGSGTPDFVPNDKEFPILSINPGDAVTAHEKAAGRTLTEGLELGFSKPVSAFVGKCEHINVVMYGVSWSTSDNKASLGMLAGANGDRMTVLKPYFDKVLEGWEYYGKNEAQLCGWISKDGWTIVVTDEKGGKDNYAYEHEIQIISNTPAQNAPQALTVRKAQVIKPLKNNFQLVVRR